MGDHGIFLKSALGLMTSLFGFYYVRDAVRNRKTFSRKPWPAFLGTGLLTNFFDTLGIGSFAQQTAIFKFFKLVDDRIIPGTMNVGNTDPDGGPGLHFHDRGEGRSGHPGRDVRGRAGRVRPRRRHRGQNGAVQDPAGDGDRPVWSSP